MIIIGLDMATKRTGFSVLKDNELIDYGNIDGNKNDDFRARIKTICAEIENLIIKYKPDIVFIEDVPIIKKDMHSSTSLLFIMQGYILHMVDKYNIEYNLFMPGTWRSKLGIATQPKEGAKQGTVDWVNNKFNLNFIYKKDSVKSDDNITDAIGVACCGLLR